MGIREQDEKLMNLIKGCDIKIADKIVPARWYNARTLDDITDITIDKTNALKKSVHLPQITVCAGKIKLRTERSFALDTGLVFRRNFFATAWSSQQDDTNAIIDKIIANYGAFEASGFSVKDIYSLRKGGSFQQSPTIFKICYYEILGD